MTLRRVNNYCNIQKDAARVLQALYMLNSDTRKEKDVEKFAKYIDSINFKIKSMPESEKIINDSILKIRNYNKTNGLFGNDAIDECGVLNAEMFTVYSKMLEGVEVPKREIRTFD